MLDSKTMGQESNNHVLPSTGYTVSANTGGDLSRRVGCQTRVLSLERRDHVPRLLGAILLTETYFKPVSFTTLDDGTRGIWLVTFNAFRIRRECEQCRLYLYAGGPVPGIPVVIEWP